MTENKATQKSREANELNQATESILSDIRRKDIKFRTWLIITLTVLLGLAVFGVYRQNQIANQNKAHIDCIVKLFTSTDRANKIITSTANACDVVVAK